MRVSIKVGRYYYEAKQQIAIRLIKRMEVEALDVIHLSKFF